MRIEKEMVEVSKGRAIGQGGECFILILRDTSISVEIVNFNLKMFATVDPLPFTGSEGGQ